MAGIVLLIDINTTGWYNPGYEEMAVEDSKDITFGDSIALFWRGHLLSGCDRKKTNDTVSYSNAQSATAISR